MRSRVGAMRLSVVAGALTVLLVTFATLPTAHAFCIENETGTRLFFVTWVKGKRADGAVQSQWLAGGEGSCQTPDQKAAILEVFAYASEESLEGCDDEIAGDGTLRLTAFEEFDNCIWKKKR